MYIVANLDLRSKMRMTRANLLMLLCMPALFIYSMVLVSPYTEGDQEHYRKFYEVIQNKTLLETFKLSVSYLDAYEPMGFVVLWIGAKIGIDKDIYISILNVILIYYLLLFLINKRTKSFLIFLFITNFYLIVLMTGAERLKISYIFLVIFTVTSVRVRSVLLVLASFTHFQTVILLISGIIGSLDAAIRSLLKSFTIKKRGLISGVILFLFFAAFAATFYDGIISKVNSYLRDEFKFDDFLQIIILGFVALLLVENKLRVFLVLLSIMPFLVAFGGSRVNMIAFTAIIYFIILEGRQNTIPVYALMLYMSLKSIPFVLNIYTYGNGFAVQ